MKTTLLVLLSVLCAAAFAADGVNDGASATQPRHHFHDKAAFKACLSQAGITAGADGKVDWKNVSSGDKAELHQCMVEARQQFKQKLDACLESKGVKLPLSRPLDAETKQELKSCFSSLETS
jgi:hypothetical protein